MGVESCGPTFVTTILVSRLTKRHDGYGEIGTLSSVFPCQIICSSAISIWRSAITIWRSAEQDRPGTKHGAAMVRRSDLLARLWSRRRAMGFFESMVSSDSEAKQERTSKSRRRS